jgi:hypothetical protein
MDLLLALTMSEAIRFNVRKEDLSLFLETLLVGMIKTKSSPDLVEVLREMIRCLDDTLSA